MRTRDFPCNVMLQNLHARAQGPARCPTQRGLVAPRSPRVTVRFSARIYLLLVTGGNVQEVRSAKSNSSADTHGEGRAHTSPRAGSGPASVWRSSSAACLSQHRVAETHMRASLTVRGGIRTLIVLQGRRGEAGGKCACSSCDLTVFSGTVVGWTELLCGAQAAARRLFQPPMIPN